MKIQTLVMLAAGTCLGSAALADTYSNATNWGMANGPIGLSTGPMSGSGVTAPAGFVWSECPNDGAGTANTVAGFSAQSVGPFQLAEDLTIPAGETWTVTEIKLYAYVTGSAPGVNPWTAFQVGVLNNDGAGGSPGTVKHALSPAAGFTVKDTNIYRVFSTTTPPPGTVPGTTRLVREVTIPVAWTLDAGNTYWINLSNNAGFVPPLTDPLGTRGLAGWKSYQLSAGVWGVVIDAGNPGTGPDVQQDFPMVITYTKDAGCYPDCDGDTVLSIDDFICFQTFFALGDPYADCDGDTTLSIDDFICFQTFFAIGC